MPLLTLTNLAANAVNDFMVDSDQGPQNFRFIGPAGAQVQWGMNATALEAELEVYASGIQIVPRSRVQSGGTIGVPPDMQAFGQVFDAPPGSILEFRVRETAGTGTVDLNLFIDVVNY